MDFLHILARSRKKLTPCDAYDAMPMAVGRSRSIGLPIKLNLSITLVNSSSLDRNPAREHD